MKEFNTKLDIMNDKYSEYLEMNSKRSSNLEFIKKTLLEVDPNVLSLIFLKEKKNDNSNFFRYYFITFEKMKDKKYQDIKVLLNNFGLYFYYFDSDKEYYCHDINFNIKLQKGDIVNYFFKENNSSNILFGESFLSYVDESNKILSKTCLYVKGKEDKFFFNQSGQFIGFNFQKFFYKNYFFIEDQKHFKFIDSIFNIKNFLNFLPKSIADNAKFSFFSKNISELENKKNFLSNKINDLSKITISVENYSKNFVGLGSGIIFEFKKNSDYQYEYYILTNRHVIKSDVLENESDIKNKIFYIRNNFLFKELVPAEVYFYIDNEHEYDDFAVLKFIYNIPKDKTLDHRFQNEFLEINKIIQELNFNVDVKNNFNVGGSVYTLCSQLKCFGLQELNSFENQNFYNNYKCEIFLNLFKKGIISTILEKEIIFDITIESGNSGSPLFDYKGNLIGINRSSSKPNNLSQAININYIKDNIKLLKYLKDKDNDRISFCNPSSYNMISKIKNDIKNFQDNIIFKKKDRVVISLESIIKSNISQIFLPDMSISLLDKDEYFVKFIIQGFNDISYFIEYNPYKEKLEVFFDIVDKEKSKYKIIFLKKDLKKNIKEKYVYGFDDRQYFKNKIFFILENNNKTNENYLNDKSLDYNISNEKLLLSDDIEEIFQKKIIQNIINSLVSVEFNYNYNGLGIIINKNKIFTRNNEYYFVYDVLMKEKKYLSQIPNFKKLNFFWNNNIILNIVNNNQIFQEIGALKSYFCLDNTNWNLISFISNNNYSQTSLNKGSFLLGENIYFINNPDTKFFSFQVFKSNLSGQNLLSKKEYSSPIKNTNLFLNLPFEQVKMKKIFENNLENDFLIFDHRGFLILINDEFKSFYSKSPFIISFYALSDDFLIILKKKIILMKDLNLFFYSIIIFISYILQKKFYNKEEYLKYCSNHNLFF